MFKTGKRLLAALMCAAALLTCLAGCGEDRPAGSELTGPVRTGPVTPEATPRERLTAAVDKTMADLEARLDASLLAGLRGLTADDAITADVTVGFPDEAGEVLGTLSGKAVFNAGTGEARADLVISTDEMPLNIYYGPEFTGVSCKKLFGNETFFGLRPYGLTEQLQGSALAELIELDMDAVAQLDALLASVPQDVNVFTLPEKAQIENAVHELIAKLTLTAAADTVTVGGRELTGERFDAVIPAGDMADFLKALANALPEWVLAYGLGTGDDSAAAVDEALEALRQSGMETKVSFTVAEGKLRSFGAEYAENASTTWVSANLYGDNGETVTVTMEPCFAFTLDLHAGVLMELSVPQGQTTKLDWAGDGSLSFITYAGDYTDFALEGTLTAEGGSLRYDGIWYSGERGDRNVLTVSTTPGGEITPPADTRNITELTSRQLYGVIMKTVFNLFK